MLALPKWIDEESPLLQAPQETIEKGNAASILLVSGSKQENQGITSKKSAQTSEQPVTTARIVFGATATAFLFSLTACVLIPTLDFTLREPEYESQVSILKMVVDLWQADMWLAAASIVLFAIVCPATEMVIYIAEAAGAVVSDEFRFFLQSFSMFDVFLVGTGISSVIAPVITDVLFEKELKRFGRFEGLVAPTVEGNISLSMSPTGWLVTLFATCWGVFALVFGSKPKQQRKSSKEQ